jgi:hypothetical protein
LEFATGNTQLNRQEKSGVRIALKAAELVAPAPKSGLFDRVKS